MQNIGLTPLALLQIALLQVFAYSILTLLCFYHFISIIQTETEAVIE